MRICVCTVKSCKNKSNSPTGSSRLFFSFPKDPVLRARWAKAIGVSEVKRDSKRKICENHFEPSHIINKNLVINACPSVYLGDCVVNHCNATMLTDMHFKFPVQPNVRQKWINFVKKTRPNFEIGNLSKICARHFTRFDYDKNFDLLSTAIPSVYIKAYSPVPGTSSDVESSNSIPKAIDTILISDTEGSSVDLSTDSSDISLTPLRKKQWPTGSLKPKEANKQPLNLLPSDDSEEEQEITIIGNYAPVLNQAIDTTLLSVSEESSDDISTDSTDISLTPPKKKQRTNARPKLRKANEQPLKQLLSDISEVEQTTGYVLGTTGYVPVVNEILDTSHSSPKKKKKPRSARVRSLENQLLQQRIVCDEMQNQINKLVEENKKLKQNLNDVTEKNMMLGLLIFKKKFI